MARKRALSNTVKAEETTISKTAGTPAKNRKKNGSTPLSQSTRKSTRSSVAKAKAESPDALAKSPIVTHGRVKKEELDDGDGDSAIDEKSLQQQLPSTPAPRTTPKRTTRSNKKTNLNSSESDGEIDDTKSVIQDTPSKLLTSSATVNTPSKSTLAKKLKQLEQYLQTPFPDYIYPTPEQCQNVQSSLAKVHGLPKRPSKLLDIEGAAAGCGAVPDVLDALVRTILSQNTTSANSTRAKNAMDARFGRANYAAVHKAPTGDLAETIACGGLANVKAKVIKKVLQQLVSKQMEADPLLKESDIETISLDYLHGMSDLDAMKELVSFDGVGPKTASCVLLFCLGRNSFAVDTHVFRITKALGWTPAKANRETAFQHLDVRIPDENKYPLHTLLVKHGRSCRNCSANGNITDPEVDSKQCPIKQYLKEARSLAGTTSKGKMEDDEEDLAGMLPKDIKDEEAVKDEM